MQQPQRRTRSRIRRYLRNLTSFLRPMPRDHRNPPPGNVPLEANLLPLPQPPPTPTMTRKNGDHIPPMPANVPNTRNTIHHISDQTFLPHHPSDVFPQHDFRGRPASASFPMPSTHPQAMPNTFSHTLDTNLPTMPAHEPHRRLRINRVPMGNPPSRVQPPQMTVEQHSRAPPIRIRPPSTRMQTHPVRAHSDLSYPTMGNPRDVYHSLPVQPPDARNYDRQQMLMQALQRRASGMYRPAPQHTTAHFPVGDVVQVRRDGVDRMLVDTLPDPTRVTRVPNSAGVQNVGNVLTMQGVQRVGQVPAIGLMPPPHGFMNNPSIREYTPQLSIPTSNTSFTLPETTSQQPQSSQFPDPTLLPSSIPPEQLARLYGMLQRSTNTARPPPQSSTPRPIQPGKSRRGQKHRSQKSPRSPRSRAARLLKGDHIFRMLTLSQAPSHWFGALEITQVINGRSGNVTIPVGAFLYSLTNKPAFTASLPDSIKLSTDTARKFDDVVNTAAGGQFMIRVSPVNDYGHTVRNTMYANFINTCLRGAYVHCVQMDAGSLFLFPVSFPQSGLALVGIFVSN